MQFIPQRGAFIRGIYSVSYLQNDLTVKQASELYNSFYQNHPFTKLVPFDPNIKHVANTNKCFISIQKQNDTLIIISVIDNLLKGAAGQAIQNMNLMFGINETTGLDLKPTAY